MISFPSRALFLALCFLPGGAWAGDWPMWRFDSGRGAATPDALPAELHLQWTRQLPEPMPAWPVTQAKLQFDLQAEPVVTGERIFVPSSKNDSVTAFSTRTGDELWRFYADGPVRFAPVAHDGKVFFNADDGCLYALNAADGKLIWKVNGAPERRWILGNHRLISMWPSRGGAVLHEGKLFFTASIWPFMGIFIHAVDPDSGEIVWTNSGDGTNYTVQPHSAPAFASVVPQGHLAADGNNLVVPGGRSTPAVYDTGTGEQKHFKFDKRNGGHNVMASGDLLFVAGHAYLMKDGKPIGGGAPAVIDRENRMMIATDPASILARDTSVEIKSELKIDRKGVKFQETAAKFRELFQTKLDDRIPGTWQIKAGGRLFAGGGNRIAAYELKKDDPVWESEIAGEFYTMLAADDRLFVVTGEGVLHCFGAEKPAEVARHSPEQTLLKAADDKWVEQAKEILGQPGASEGFALVLGVESGRLIEEMLRQSELHIVAVDLDAQKIEALRRKVDATGFYGSRFSAFVGDFEKEKFPPYLCNLITSEVPGMKIGTNAEEALRPYGGVAVLPDESGGISITTREGPLPDSDDWSHQYANAAQTVVSRDGNVKAPFGVLWFGGPSHAGILPRHGHGPSPQVAGGRLFIEGADMLRAVDVYTGRLLWERELPGFGEYYDETGHFPGAGEIGSNYVSLPEKVYAVYGSRILALDAATGETEREFKLPNESDNFGYLAVQGDFLVATSTPVVSDAKTAAPKPSPKPADGWADAKAVIERNATWQYLAGKDPGENWNQPGFSPDKDWKAGPAGFGYGDNDDKTVLDIRNKTARVYLRKEIDIGDLSDIEPIGKLALSISYDDAFIAYLNGKEILRKNVSKGAGSNASGIGSHEAGTFETLEIDDWKKLIREGANVLAIEGHNRSAGSSDFSLDPILLAKSGNAEPEPDKKTVPAADDTPIPTGRFASGSRRLVVFNRLTGEQLWEREAQFNFRHNNIAIADDRVFCIDKLTTQRATALARRGLKLTGQPALYALDLKTGEVLWKHDKDVFGTFLNYSAEHDIVLQAGSKYRDRAADDIGQGMVAFRGKTGDVIWGDLKIEYGGPCLIWRDRILTNGAGGFAVNLLSGEKTGWTYAREYGCNTAVGSEHLLTFRSGAAGFFDLENESGTGNLGGFRSSCTNNLIAANGVLNAPDYTRTCSCSYQNQTSLALIHMPEAEFWTYGGRAGKDRIGINFGAPGDRRSEDGTLFCEYPNTGSRSEDADVKIDGNDLSYRRVHSSAIDDGSTPWLTASAIEGAAKISIDLPEKLRDRNTDVRLWFAETDRSSKPGQRVFDVNLNGKKVLESFDIAKAAGIGIGVTKEFPGIEPGKQLEIELVPRSGSGQPLLSAIEVVKSP